MSGTDSGVYGVNLFFVLSGYLITSILLNQKGKTISAAYKNFIGRRALRIFPIYYLIVTFYILINAGDIKTDWPYLFSYTYNFHVSTIQGWEHNLYSPYWSLSVEEQFYIFFPFVILCLNKWPKWQLFVLFLIVGIALTERILGLTGVHHYVNLVTNMWPLAIGAIGAWCARNSIFNTRFFTSAWVEVFMLAGLVYVFRYTSILTGFIVYPLINVYLVIKCSAFSFQIKPIDKLLTHKWSLFVGKISYGIYLYHILILHSFNDYIFNPLWSKIPFDSLGYFSKLQYNATLIKFPFICTLTIFIAYLSFRFIESPMLKLKDRYFLNGG
jgi:peptidoglycan/LPS O-acetylase OafA/YrhL